MATAALLRGVSRLVVSRVDGEGVLGRPDLGAYVAVPEPGVVLVEALQGGATLAEATRAASAAAGAEVDGEQFLSGLAEAGLLDEPAGHGDADAAVGSWRIRSSRVRWIGGVSQRAARRLFGRVAWTCYGGAALFAAAVLVAEPDLRPTFEDAWFLPDPVLSVLVLTVVTTALTAAHEAWHWLAGRAAGVPAAFRVSYRGYFVVFETDLTQLVALPRRRRYGPFLAGMALNASVLAAALGVRLLDHGGVLPVPGLLDRFAGALVLSQVFILAWQFGAVFLRSDVYAVLANALRCNNLYRATWLTTKDRLLGLTEAERSELAAMSQHDLRVARWFGLVHVAGMLGMAWMFLTFALPFLVGMVSWLVTSLISLASTSLAFWEAVVVLALVVAQYVAPPLLALRERRLRRAGALL
jgi:hypothetical protein